MRKLFTISEEKETIPYFDKETIIEDCTVQVLENTKTGEVSVGWWEGKKEDMPIIRTVVEGVVMKVLGKEET